MRFAIVAIIAAATLAGTILPAEAAWHSYFNREAGFSFEAPGGVKPEKTTYRSPSAGQRVATVFRSVDDNVEYKVTVVDFVGHTSDEATLIKEASALVQDKKTVLADADARVESSYGRKMTLELPNKGGRSMAGIFVNARHLIRLEVTVLPANGDYGTPDMGRFIDSIAFQASAGEPGATELKLSK